MIGLLRNEVTLLAPARLADAGGGASLAWAPEGGPVWAEVRLLASATDVTSDRARRLRRIAATLRARDGLALGGRLRFGGDDYEIVSIEEADRRGKRVTLVCEEARQ